MKTRMDYCENIFQKGVTSLMYLKNTSRKCMTSLIRDLENVLDIVNVNIKFTNSTNIKVTSLTNVYTPSSDESLSSLVRSFVR